MPPPRSGLLRCLRRLSAGAASDGALLAAHAAGDPDAFRTLVARHGPLVLGVCRRLLGDAHAAEDAFQAVFLVLARKAGAPPRTPSLAAWLFGVARRVALKARASDLRRRRREASVRPPTPTDPAAELSARELFAALDEELARLPEAYRLPLLLVYWQGLTQDEAARRLGWTPGSVKGRLERGRARLAERLTRRGFAPGALLVAPLAVAAVPPDLLAATAALAAAPWSEALPAAVLALAASAAPAKLAPIAALGALIVGAGLLASAWRAGSVSDRSPDEQPPVAHAPGAPANVQANAPRIDRYGDALPDGAITRIGTSRLVHSGPTIAFSPDGRLIAVGSEGGAASAEVRISEVKTGKFLRVLKTDVVRISPSSELTFSPDSRLLAVSGFWTKAVLLWDVATGQLLHQMPNTKEGQERWGRWPENPTLAFTPDGRTLIGGGKDGGVYLWDVATGRETAHLQLEANTVIALSVTADAGLALTSHAGTIREGGDLHLWDLANRRHVRQLDVPHVGGRAQNGAQMAAIAPDGKTYVRCANSTEVEVRQTATDRVLHRIADKRVVVGLAFANDGTLWIARDGGEVTAWDTGTGERRRSVACRGIKPRSQPRSPTAMDNTEAWFSPDGRAVAWRDNPTVRLWDLTTGRESPVLAGHREGTQWVGFTADGRSLLTAGGMSEVGVWDAATGLERRPLRILTPPDAPAPNGTRYSLSADRRRVVVVGQGVRGDTRPGVARPPGQSVYLWEPDADQPPSALAEQVNRATAATLTPDGRFVVVSEDSNRVGTIRVYDAATRQLVRTFPGRYLEQCLAMTWDGAILATNTGDTSRAVRLYDFATGRVLRDLNVATFVSFLAISPDGQLVACNYHPTFEPPRPGSTAVEPAVTVWHMASGRELYRIPRDSGLYGDLTFSPDGRLLLQASGDGSMRLSEVISGQERRKYVGHEGGVRSVDFAPDGRRVASGSSDGTALIWQVFDPGPAERTDAELAAAWADLADNGATAHKAIGALLSANGAVPFLAKQLAPATAVPAERLAQIIADLDSPRFATRQEAEKELIHLADFAAAALQRALVNRPTVELRQRIEKLLQAIDLPLKNAELLRQLRAVEALEHIGTADARQVLRRLADGAPDARLTRDAKASLERLRRREAELRNEGWRRM